MFRHLCYILGITALQDLCSCLFQPADARETRTIAKQSNHPSPAIAQPPNSVDLSPAVARCSRYFGQGFGPIRAIAGDGNRAKSGVARVVDGWAIRGDRRRQTMGRPLGGWPRRCGGRQTQPPTPPELIITPRHRQLSPARRAAQAKLQIISRPSRFIHPSFFTQQAVRSARTSTVATPTRRPSQVPL